MGRQSSCSRSTRRLPGPYSPDHLKINMCMLLESEVRCALQGIDMVGAHTSKQADFPSRPPSEIMDCSFSTCARPRNTCVDVHFTCTPNVLSPSSFFSRNFKLVIRWSGIGAKGSSIASGALATSKPPNIRACLNLDDFGRTTHGLGRLY